jgi:hypothetical protein
MVVRFFVSKDGTPPYYGGMWTIWPDDAMPVTPEHTTESIQFTFL